jgi:hypothetical protein
MNYMKKFLSIIVLFASPIYAHQNQLQKKMVVQSPIADIRAYPKNIITPIALPSNSQSNYGQLTQLLFNEPVIFDRSCKHDNELWYLVTTLQQYNINSHGTSSYIKGWVKAKDLYPVKNFSKHNLIVSKILANVYDKNHHKIMSLSIATQLTGNLINDDYYCITMANGSNGFIKVKDVQLLSDIHSKKIPDLQKDIVALATKFLGFLYSWGGRSPENNSWQVSSVDCSGLINLLYASQGLIIPRNSKSQYLKSTPIDHGKDLQPGDLIFFSDQPCNSKNFLCKIHHVLLYIGNGNVIESALSTGSVKKISFKKRIGINHTQIKSGDSALVFMKKNNYKKYYIYFGSFLKNDNFIKNLII